jgi:hypothetical protein
MDYAETNPRDAEPKVVDPAVADDVTLKLAPVVPGKTRLSEALLINPDVQAAIANAIY